MLSSSRIKSVACGRYHTVALTYSNIIYVWGYNGCGQLGLGDMNDRNTPQELTLDHVTSISCGSSHTIALTCHDTLYVWGKNTCGQLGLGDYGYQVSPHKLKFLSLNIKSISCGERYTIALTLSDFIYYWGHHNHNQLKSGDVHRLVPSLVMRTADSSEGESDTIELSNIKSINCGRNHIIVMTSNDVIYVWGQNKYGRLGLGDNRDRSAKYMKMHAFSYIFRSLLGL